MIPRMYLYGAAAAAVLAIAGWIYLQGMRADDLRRAEDAQETRDRIDETLSNCADLHWSERLFCK